MIAESSPFMVGLMQTVIHHDGAELADRFAQIPAMVFDGVLEPTLLDRFVRGAEQAAYSDDTVEHLGDRGIEAPARLGPAFAVMLDRPELRDWLARVCGTSDLGRVVGRLVETRPGQEGGLRWHDDLIDPQRRLGVVVNLTSVPYEGGLFEMRRKGENTPFCVFQHTKPGTMMVFAVNAGVEHRVTPVISGGPRRVFAGWYLQRP